MMYTDEEIDRDLKLFQEERYEEIIIPMRILRETRPEKFRKINSNQSSKCWRENNPEKMTEYQKKYYIEHKTEINERDKKNYKLNSEEKKEYNRKYQKVYRQRPDVKERSHKSCKKYYDEHKEEILARAKRNHAKKKLNIASEIEENKKQNGK